MLLMPIMLKLQAKIAQVVMLVAHAKHVKVVLLLKAVAVAVAVLAAVAAVANLPVLFSRAVDNTNSPVRLNLAGDLL